MDEQLVDSQLYEQIPFQTALDDGCTHVLVLRSRPDGGWFLLFLTQSKLSYVLIFRRCSPPDISLSSRRLRDKYMYPPARGLA